MLLALLRTEGEVAPPTTSELLGSETMKNQQKVGTTDRSQQV